MADIVFINPSPNMQLLAKAVESQGKSVSKIYTQDFMYRRFNKYMVNIDGVFSELGTFSSVKSVDPLVYSFKKPFFASFRSKYIKDKLKNVNLELEYGTFQDYILLTSPVSRQENLESEPSAETYEEVLARYPLAKIVASSIPAGNGKINFTRWRTDYSLKESLGCDYFFFFDKKGVRHEMFVDGEELVTVSESRAKGDIRDLNPSFAKFDFEKTDNITFNRNYSHWVIKHSSRIFLINDYSWSNIYIKMPENWIKGLCKMLCIKHK